MRGNLAEERADRNVEADLAWDRDTGFRAQGLELMAMGLGFRIWGWGFRIAGVEFSVLG